MLPSVEDWLAASWTDYRRRWTRLMIVLAVGFIATLAAVLVPLVPTALAAYFAAGSRWPIIGVGWVVMLLTSLYVSTWAQAAAVRAAAFEESAGQSLRAGWRQTPAFAWVLSLVMLAAGGGFVLLIVPGLALTALLFLAPFYQLSGEERGMGALELSYARVKPVFGAVFARLALAGLIAWIPVWIPYAGWLIGPLWAPFGLVACARLADDLKALNSAPARPALGGAVWALSVVLVGALFAATWGATRGAAALYESYASGRLALKAPDAETAQALLAVLQGQGTDEEKLRSATYVLSLSSAAAAP